LGGAAWTEKFGSSLFSDRWIKKPEREKTKKTQKKKG